MSLGFQQPGQGTLVPEASNSPPPNSSMESIMEIDTHDPEGRAAYQRVSLLLQGQSAQRLQYLTDQAQRLMRDLGVTFTLYKEEGQRDQILRFDLFPRIIAETEWSHLSAGLTQRVRIWNAFMADIYGSQEVLKAGILPFEIVYDDPRFERGMVGLPVPKDTYVHVAAFDLARNAQHDWVVSEDYVSHTTGASYALQGRYVLSQVARDLQKTADFMSTDEYPTDLIEHLQSFSMGAMHQPRVVLLSPGTAGHAYYEHSYLARRMGIPLVTGTDLIILNSRVYLKTIGGLEPIDVIYRRLDSEFLDPISFRQDSQLGVPGLMTCVREGTVTIANAAGTGLGDNRAITTFFPKLAKFYFNENLILPTAQRFLCRDKDHLDWIGSNLRDYIIQHVSDRNDSSRWDPQFMDQAELKSLRHRILSHPDHYVADKKLPSCLLPVQTEGGIDMHHVGLRLFALGGPESRLSTCALTRFAHSKDSRGFPTALSGGIKDTWILKGREDVRQDPIIQISTPQSRLRLGSRIAENLFWMGRYSERAETAARLLRVLHSVQIEDRSVQNPLRWAPLWEALAGATGHPFHFFKKSPHVKKGTVSDYILLDSDNPGSVLSCISYCRENAKNNREAVPPEVWVIVNRLYLMLNEFLPQGSNKLSDGEELPRILDFLDRIQNQFDALYGAAAKTMLHLDAWNFLTIGWHMERALSTLTVMRQVYIRRPGRGSKNLERDESNLGTLLAMLSCQYAYRSLFHSRPSLFNVAMLILQDPYLPHSVMHCLRQIRQGLSNTFGNSAASGLDPHEWTPFKMCSKLISEVEFADLQPFFQRADSGTAPKLRHYLDDLSEKLSKLSTGIADHYLHHQAFTILR